MSHFSLALDALNRSGCRYLVVGGVAGTLHGIRRTTFDLDIILDFGTRSTHLAITNLLSAGFTTRLPIDPLDLANPELRNQWVREKNLKALPLYLKSASYFVVDLFAYHPLDFEQLYSRSKIIPFEKISTRIVSIEDLILLKQMAGRPKDLLDLEELKSLIGK